jgi:hypothetical protein
MLLGLLQRSTNLFLWIADLKSWLRIHSTQHKHVSMIISILLRTQFKHFVSLLRHSVKHKDATKIIPSNIQYDRETLYEDLLKNKVELNQLLNQNRRLQSRNKLLEVSHIYEWSKKSKVIPNVDNQWAMNCPHMTSPINAMLRSILLSRYLVFIVSCHSSTYSRNRIRSYKTKWMRRKKKFKKLNEMLNWPISKKLK